MYLATVQVHFLPMYLCTIVIVPNTFTSVHKSTYVSLQYATKLDIRIYRGLKIMEK